MLKSLQLIGEEFANSDGNERKGDVRVGKPSGDYLRRSVCGLNSPLS